jgi:hypothetical protein
MAYNIIVSEEGKSFDPCLVRLFKEYFGEFRQIAIDHFEINPDELPFQMSRRDRDRSQDSTHCETKVVTIPKFADHKNIKST